MSMEGFNFSRINPEYNNLRGFNQQARIVDFVLLDTTTHTVGGIAYQLVKEIIFSDEELKAIKQGTYQFPKTPFAPLGEVKEVKHQSKQLVMTDGNTVHYSYLVVVKGTKPSMMSFEFLAAIYTLVDALRVQKWIPEAMLPPPNLKPKVDISASPTAKLESDRAWLDYLPDHKEDPGTYLYTESNRKLYHVHL